MNKVKINSGLVCLILVAAIFPGWSTLLTVSILVLIFADIDETSKNTLTRVIAFYIGVALVALAWDIIYDGIDIGLKSIDKLVDTINSYLDYGDKIDISKFSAYLLHPISNLATVANYIVDYLLIIAKFGFIVAMLTGKKMKDNMIVTKINGYLDKAINYVNSMNGSYQNYQQQPQQYNQGVDNNMQNNMPNQNMNGQM